MNKYILICITISAALFSSLAADKTVAKKDEASTQSREIIEIAQNLLLQKDRDQAVRLLFKAQITEKNKALAAEIRAILKDIGSLFLFDKSQQEFESSISFKKTDPSKWLSAVERAQKIEPDNTLVMYELIRNQINKKNLNRAKEILEEFRTKNAFDKNVVLASAFLQLASNDGKDLSLVKAKLKELQLSNYALVAGYFDVLEKVLSGNKDKALAAVAQLKKDDPLNPQIAYWENRINGKPKSDEEAICESFPEHYYRRYYHDLFFCSSALENFFKFKDVNSI